MGGRGSQGGRLKSSLREGAPSPVWGGGCRLVVARLGHLKGSAGGKAASLHSGGAGEGLGRDGSSARTGSTWPPAHGFSTLSLALRRDQGRTLRPASRRFSNAALDEDPRAGEAWKACAWPCPNSSHEPHPPLRALACGASVLSRSGQNRIPPPQPTPRARPS